MQDEEYAEQQANGRIVTYFIQSDDGGPIKIGRSREKRVDARLRDLQVGNPARLVVRRTMVGDFEAMMHDRFASARLSGEWFDPTPELCKVAKIRREKKVRYDAIRDAFLAGFEAGVKAEREATQHLIVREAEKLAEHAADFAQDFGDGSYYEDEHFDALRKYAASKRTRSAHAPETPSAVEPISKGQEAA